MTKLTVRGLAFQLQDQGRLLLQALEDIKGLKTDAARRDRLAIANAVSRVTSEEARADLPERAALTDYGLSVREPTLREVASNLEVQIASLRDEVREFMRDQPEPSLNSLELERGDDECAASCHLIADTLEAREHGKVWQGHIDNLRRAARRLRREV